MDKIIMALLGDAAGIDWKVVQKPHKKGGCRVTDRSVPGMYYEKVYTKVFLLRSILFI